MPAHYPMTPKHRLLYKTIDEILWNDWDPIGCGVPRDEYEYYTPVLFKLKINGATKDMIVKKLYQIETVTIGVAGDKKRCERVAEQILNLKLITNH